MAVQREKWGDGLLARGDFANMEEVTLTGWFSRAVSGSILFIYLFQGGAQTNISGYLTDGLQAHFS